MQKSSHIARLFSVFLMSLIMMFTVFGKTFSATQLHQKEVQKAKTEQSNHSEKSEKNASISELSVMQVSASATIDFSHGFVFTSQAFSFLMPEKKFSLIRNLSFRLPLLEILFEHFIVTNAP